LAALEKAFGCPAVKIYPGYNGSYVGQPKLARSVSGDALITTVGGCLLNPEISALVLTSGVAKLSVNGSAVKIPAYTTSEVTLVEGEEFDAAKHLKLGGLPAKAAKDGDVVTHFMAESTGEGEKRRITGFFQTKTMQFRATLKEAPMESPVGKAISNKNGMVTVGSLVISKPMSLKIEDMEGDFNVPVLSVEIAKLTSKKTGQPFEAVSVNTELGVLGNLPSAVAKKLKSMQALTGLRIVKDGKNIYLESPALLDKYKELGTLSV
jgi:hypothetical protein